MFKRYVLCVSVVCLSAFAVLSYQDCSLAEARRDLRARSRQADTGRTSTARVHAPARAFSIPFAFEPAAGRDGVQFVGRGGPIAIALTPQGIEMAAGWGGRAPAAVALVRFAVSGNRSGPPGLVWRGTAKLRGTTNYLLGNHPAEWRTHVPRFERVEATTANFGLAAYPQRERIEYDLRIPPGGNPSQIRMAISGARNVRIDPAGNLVMRVGRAEFRMGKPAIYEQAVFEDSASRGNGPGPSRSRGAVSGTAAPRKRKSARRAGTRTGARHSRTRSGATTRHRTRRANGRRRSRTRRTHTSSVSAQPADAEAAGGGRSPGEKPPSKTTARHPLEGGYVIEANGEIGFRITGRDPRATLVIDPTISLAYSSFLGGMGTDVAASIAADSTGKIYVAGTTNSPETFPETPAMQLGPGLPAGPATGSPAHEFFIAKIDPAQTGANSLVYLTYLGGSTDQLGGLIAVDSAGDVAITGTTTSSDFPVTDGSARTSGANDTSVSEIDPTGSKLLYSTLLGGSGAESQQAPGGIAVDSNGNIFVASDTNSPDLPATVDSYAIAYTSPVSDGFLAKFQPAATPALQYCTYLGLNGQIGIGGVAVDVSGNAYLAGFTSDPNADFPSKNAVQSAYQGGAFDAFLMKIAPQGNGAADLIYATLLGGSGSDQAIAVAVDSQSPPNAYITGTTSSTNFPTGGAVAAYQPKLPSNATAATSDAFVSVVAQSLATGQTSLAYSTYLGGSETDTGYAIEAAEPYAVYVAGTANSWDFPWRDNFQPFNGYGNAFVAKLDTTTPAAASLIFSTPLGGTTPAGLNAGTQGRTIVLDPSGNVWIAGQTTSLDFPSAGNPGNGFQLICGSCQESPIQADAFVAEIQENVSAQLPSLYFAGPGIPLNFGTQAIGAADVPPQFAAIKNGGEAALTIAAIGIAGPNAADFSLTSATGCTAGSISPGGMCSFEVNFIPSVAGPEEAFVQATSNAPGNPQVLELIGTGAGLASIPGSLNFGKQIAGTTSAPQSVTLSNTGSETLYIDSVTEGGANPAMFAPANTSQQCVASANGIPPGGSCLIAMTFTPTSTGTFTAEVDITYQLYGLPQHMQTIPLTGTGITEAPIAVIAPTALDFGSVTVAASTGAQVVTLTNTGSAALDITGISLTGTNAADFTIVSAGIAPCPATSGSVAINASCTLGLEFTPQTAGSKSAALSFADNAAGSPQTVVLSGTAQAPGGVQIAPSTLTFSAQAVAIKSAAQQVSISNNGGTSLAINGISLTGTNAADFSETNNCPPSLSPNAGCVVSVVFDPVSPGTRSASLKVADSAAGSPQMIALNGTATQPAVTLSSAAINFGNQAVGTPSSPVSVVVTNSGNGALAITGISLAGTNTGDFSETDNCTGSSAQSGVAPSATCAIQITFKPACGTATAMRTAVLTLADNAPGSPQNVSLGGTGTGAFCFMLPSGSSTSAIVSPGQTGGYALQVEAANGFTGNVDITCAGAPAAATCTAAPASVNVGGSELAPLQVSVATSAGSAAAVSPPPGNLAWRASPQLRGGVLWLVALAILIALVLYGRTRRERRGNLGGTHVPSQPRRKFARIAALAGTACVLAAALASCGGGGSQNTVANDPATPAGTYTITVAGTTSSGASQSIMLTLTVD